MTTLIYALTDPDTGEIRYVGKTFRTLADRLKSHIYQTNRGMRSHRDCWVRKLMNAGKFPSICLLEECEGDGSAEERFHISLARADGLRLTNGTDGGERDYRLSEESRRKIGDSKRGKPADPKSIAALVAYHTGRKHSPEFIQKRLAPLRGRKLSPELVKRRADSRRGWRPSPEQVEKMAVTKRGTHHRDDTKAALHSAMRRHLCGDLDESFGLFVLAARIRSGLSVEALAKKSGLHTTAIYRIELGKKVASTKNAEVLRRCLA